MVVSCQHHAPLALPQGKNPNNNRVGFEHRTVPPVA